MKVSLRIVYIWSRVYNRVSLKSFEIGLGWSPDVSGSCGWLRFFQAQLGYTYAILCNHEISYIYISININININVNINIKINK